MQRTSLSFLFYHKNPQRIRGNCLYKNLFNNNEAEFCRTKRRFYFARKVMPLGKERQKAQGNCPVSGIEVRETTIFLLARIGLIKGKKDVHSIRRN